MSIFTKPISQLETADAQELLQDKAVENIRLEFKWNVPDKDETLKKLSSFANSFGGFMVVGAKANSADGRIEDLTGVDEQAGYKQKVVQWCFDGASPPLVVEVSEAIPAPSASGKFCYVIYTAESDVAPHFLNGRKGVWVRSDEFSQRFEACLANENELRHLLDRRQLIHERRAELIRRSIRRYETFRDRSDGDSPDVVRRREGARLELSLGPRFPARPLCEQARLVDLFNTCRINWRQTHFPLQTSSIVSQHESVLSLAPGKSNSRTLVEANIWGVLFYATELAIEIQTTQETSISGIHLYRLIGHLLVFVEHARQMVSRLGYEGLLTIDLILSGILNIPWLYTEFGVEMYKGPVSELDDAFSFSLPTNTDMLRERPDALVMNMMQYILFGMNWADYASRPDVMEPLLRTGYKYNYWDEPAVLRL